MVKGGESVVLGSGVAWKSGCSMGLSSLTNLVVCDLELGTNGVESTLADGGLVVGNELVMVVGGLVGASFLLVWPFSVSELSTLNTGLAGT